VDLEKGELHPEAAKGVALTLLREVPFKTKLGISGWCATHRESVRVDSVQTDARFNRAVDVITGIRTRSILCVPLIRKDVVFGIIELVNRVDGAFTDEDQAFLEAFARHAGIALSNCRERQSVSDRLAYDASLIENLHGAVVATDLRGAVMICNSAACRLLNVAVGDVLGQPVAKALAGTPEILAIIETVQKKQAPVARQEVRLKRAGGPVVVGYSTFIIRGRDRNHGVAVIFQDITPYVDPGPAK
jgi:adenylate cyclase